MTYITVQQAAKLLGVHSNTIRNWLKAGIVRRYQVGPGYRVLLKTEDIEQAFKQRNVMENKEKGG